MSLELCVSKITCTSKVDPRDLLALAFETLKVLQDNDERHSCSLPLSGCKNRLGCLFSRLILNDRASPRIADDIVHSFIHHLLIHVRGCRANRDPRSWISELERKRNKERERGGEDRIPRLHQESISLLRCGIEPGERGGAQQRSAVGSRWRRGPSTARLRRVKFQSPLGERTRTREWARSCLLEADPSTGPVVVHREYARVHRGYSNNPFPLPHSPVRTVHQRDDSAHAPFRAMRGGRPKLARVHPRWNHHVTWRRASLISDVCAFFLSLSLFLSFFLSFSGSLVPSCLPLN